MDEIWRWVFGGGLITVLGMLFKWNGDMRQMKVDAAERQAEIVAAKAREAQFDASISESSTKVAGEGILKGLLSTLVQREQIALTELKDAREQIGGLREEVAEMREQEAHCQEDLRQLRETQLNQHTAHSAEIKALHGRIYNMSQRMLAAGGAFTATDVVPNHGPDR